MANNQISLLETELRSRLQVELKTLGLRLLSGKLGLHPQTVLAIAAGIPVRMGSLALVERYFEAIGSESATPTQPPAQGSANK